MGASTALQTTLKYIFFDEMHNHISLKCLNFNCLIAPAGIDNFSNLFWGNYENPIAIEATLVKKSFWGKPCLLNVRVTAATLESNTLV